MILITGSSGYVATHLLPLLKDWDCIGIDLLEGNQTNVVLDIANYHPPSSVNVVVSLAAARFDYGVSADEYFIQNVDAHISFWVMTT
jgi:nucleoside-diphosphate-sugar epimerase